MWQELKVKLLVAPAFPPAVKLLRAAFVSANWRVLFDDLPSDRDWETS